MIKNITLSAEERRIQAARKKAKKENTSLNQLFRNWINAYLSTDSDVEQHDRLMNRLSYGKPGKKFSRDEMNER